MPRPGELHFEECAVFGELFGVEAMLVRRDGGFSFPSSFPFFCVGESWWESFGIPGDLDEQPVAGELYRVSGRSFWNWRRISPPRRCRECGGGDACESTKSSSPSFPFFFFFFFFPPLLKVGFSFTGVLLRCGQWRGRTTSS